MTATLEQVRHYRGMLEEVAHGPALEAARRIWPELTPAALVELEPVTIPALLEALRTGCSCWGQCRRRAAVVRRTPAPVPELETARRVAAAVHLSTGSSLSTMAREARNRGYLVTGGSIWPKVTPDPWGDAR